MGLLGGAMAGVAEAAGAAAGVAVGGALGSAAGPVSSANLTYAQLQNKYGDFALPRAEIVMGGKKLSNQAGNLAVNEIHIELSAAYEASAASFRIFNLFDPNTGKFEYDQIKSQVLLGGGVSISLGYQNSLSLVFMGFVAGVAFGYEEQGLPYVEVTALDAKGLMMGSCLSRQCTAKSYGKAVEEQLDAMGFEKLKSWGIVSEKRVADTPDANQAGGGSQAASAYTVELVGESVYEFIVKAARKFNLDFFVDRGAVTLRKAKSETSTLATLGSGSGIISFRVEYSLTGIVGGVEARAMNPGEGKVITAAASFPEGADAVSTGSKAAGLTGSVRQIYIDPTIDSPAQAEARAAFLKEKMGYRLGTLEAECVGIPELVPGRFLKLDGLGVPVDNSFYLTQVEHHFTGEEGYRTRITGRANRVQTAAAGGLGGSL